MNRIDSLLKRLTIEEKISLCSGASEWRTQSISRLRVPSIWLASGTSGLQKEILNKKHEIHHSHYATCFPAPVNLASSWDRLLVQNVASAIAEEALNQQVSTLLSPGVNIKRSPLGGKSSENFSEDPYLAGTLGKHYVRGLQHLGVGAAIKNFAVYNQETNKLSIDAIVDERALFEIYLKPFEIAIKQSQPIALLTSTHKLNGTYANEDRFLLQDILRNRWGFLGMTMSWSSFNNRVLSMKAGLDLEMPGNSGVNNIDLMRAIEDHKLSKEDINRAAARILNMVENTQRRKPIECDYNAHYELSREALEKSAVLLKNQDNILPLNLQTDAITVIGRFASNPRYQSSSDARVTPRDVVSFIDVLKEKMIHYEYVLGYSAEHDRIDERLIEEAVSAARKNNKIILFLGLTDSYETEGMDRTHLRLPENQLELLKRVSEVNKQIIVVLSGGSPIEMPWLKRVKGLLNIYLGGEAVGEATYNLLLNKVNPSGKLAESYPLKLEDVPSYSFYPMGPKYVTYNESIYVGYRYYETVNLPVLFPFGYGLSYTKFRYYNLKLETASVVERQPLNLTFIMENIGDFDGEEIAQLYIEPINPVNHRPRRELKEFIKVPLKVKQKKRIALQIPYSSFSYYDENLHRYVVENGNYLISIGTSSQEILLQQQVFVSGTKGVNRRQSIPEYYFMNSKRIPKKGFAKLVNYPDYENKGDTIGTFTLESTLGDLKQTALGKRFHQDAYKLVRKSIHFSSIDSVNDMVAHQIVEQMPFKLFIMVSNGKITNKMGETIIEVCNERRSVVPLAIKLLMKK